MGRVRLIAAILAGAQILVAGSALADVIGAKWAALSSLIVGAGQAGLAAYRTAEEAPPPPVVPPTKAGEQP